MKHRIGATLLVAVIFGTLLPLDEAAGQDSETELSYIFELAADQLVEFTVAGTIPGIQQKTRQIARCLANMPPEHRTHIVPIYVVPALSGGRRTGGGWFPNTEGGGANLRSWLNRQAVTGIPNSVIEEDIARGVAGIVAVTHSRFLPGVNSDGDRTPPIHYLSALHEMGHSIQIGGLALTEPSVRVDQLGQTYNSDEVREHAADAYSRYITRPGAICRATALPSGETIQSCTQRVRGLLRAAPAFAGVDPGWRPLPGCQNNASLDDVSTASTPTGVDTDSDDDAGEDPTPTAADNGPAAPSSANIPRGKGLFFRPRPFVTRNDRGQNIFDASYLGTPEAFYRQLRNHDISWIAMPRNAAPVFTRGVVAGFEPYARALTSGSEPIRIFVWNGGPEDPADYEGQVDRMVAAATAWGAGGIIIDPEGSTWRQPNRARRLAEKAREAASAANLTVGYTDFAASRRWTGTAIDHYSQLDYGMPQIYDRFDTQPSNYPERKIRAWQQKFEIVIPLSAFHHCDPIPARPSQCGPTRPKTDAEARQLLGETNVPNGALGWWTHDFLVQGNFWDLMRDHNL